MHFEHIACLVSIDAKPTCLGRLVGSFQGPLEGLVQASGDLSGASGEDLGTFGKGHGGFGEHLERRMGSCHRHCFELCFS